MDIDITLTASDARVLAAFLKSLQIEDFQRYAADADEASKIQTAAAKVGFALTPLVRTPKQNRP